MSSIIRVGVTFPPELLKELDRVVKEIGYESRSKAIQDSVKQFITDYEWTKKEKGIKAGVLVIIYDHEVKGLEETLTDIQHHYGELIRSSMHIHLSEKYCLEAIAFKGEVEEILKLTKEIMSKKGVIQSKLAIVSPF
ncbi:MAG: nickel-responsive transcriptional regulator NikR [Candidatus Bathyarchaeia archaeon]